MKKIILLISVLCMGLQSFSQSQSENEAPMSRQVIKVRQDMFEATVGILLYNVYKGQEFAYELIDAGKLSGEAAKEYTEQQKSTLRYLVDELQKLVDVESPAGKKSDLKFYKDIKKALVLLSSQSTALSDYLENKPGAKDLFINNRSTTWRAIVAVMKKE